VKLARDQLIAGPRIIYQSTHQEIHIKGGFKMQLFSVFFKNNCSSSLHESWTMNRKPQKTASGYDIVDRWSS
jgi:hypothetical protein